MNYNEGVKISIISLVLNLFLAIMKILSGIFGHSSAMLADGLHTVSDFASTIFVIIGLKISSREADKKHPYGHERFELIFAKILSFILLITGLFIGYNGINNILSDNLVVPNKITLYIAIISILVKEFMFRYTYLVAKKIDSVSLKADAWHHRSDALSSIATFIGIFGALKGFPILDPIAALIVSLMIIKVGIELMFTSIRGLIDESVDKETRSEIIKIIKSTDGVNSINDLKTRIFSNYIYIDLDIVVDGHKTVYEGHLIATEVHDRLENEIPNVKHVMVHVEPDKNS